MEPEGMAVVAPVYLELTMSGGTGHCRRIEPTALPPGLLNRQPVRRRAGCDWRLEWNVLAANVLDYLHSGRTVVCRVVGRRAEFWPAA